jgi:hypothetical protein
MYIVDLVQDVGTIDQTLEKWEEVGKWEMCFALMIPATTFIACH